MFTLLLEVDVMCGQRWIQFEFQDIPSRVFSIDGKIYITIFLWQNIHYQPVWSFVFSLPITKSVKWITTNILDMFRIITLKQHKLSQSDPVLTRQFSKKWQPDPVLILPKFASVLIQSDPVLIRAHHRFIGSVYFTANMLAATDRLELLCRQSNIRFCGMRQFE